MMTVIACIVLMIAIYNFEDEGCRLVWILKIVGIALTAMLLIGSV